MDYKVGDTVFLHWQIAEEIGSGAYGTVYKLEREEFGEKYVSALKVIKIPPSESDIDNLRYEGMSKADISTYITDIAKGFMGEIKLLEQLKGNSNIVSYEDHTVEADEQNNKYTILIRMELLTPLKAKMAEQPLSEQDIIRLGCDVCNALELCEKHKIIHRDIKPDNIFVSKDGVFKIGDFGVARTVEKTVSAMSQKGTYSYMAPEVYWGREYNKNVDIYSLGIVLYQLLNNNRTPFLPPAPQPIKFSDRENATKIRMDGTPVPPLKIENQALNLAVLKACAPMPAARFNSAAEFKAALENALKFKGAPADGTVNKNSASNAAGGILEKAAPQPMPQPAPQPIPQPAPQPMQQPAPQPVPQPAPQPVIQPVIQPVLQTVPETEKAKSAKPAKKAKKKDGSPAPKPDKLEPVRYLLLFISVMFLCHADHEYESLPFIVVFLSFVAAIVTFVLYKVKKIPALKTVAFGSLILLLSAFFNLISEATYFYDLSAAMLIIGAVFAVLSIASVVTTVFADKKMTVPAKIFAGLYSFFLPLGYATSDLRFELSYRLGYAIPLIIFIVFFIGFCVLCFVKISKKEDADV